MDERFQISRKTGKSNQQVVIDLVAGQPPGKLFEFKDLITALGKGSDRTYQVADARQIVLQANSRLLKEHKRVLHSVRGVGYRIAEAEKHNPLALDRKKRSEAQLKKGIELLRNVKWDELGEQARIAHEGTLLVLESLHQNQSAYEARQEGIMAAIHGLRQEVNNLKESKAG